MYGQDRQPIRTDASIPNAQTDWLSFDCESLGRFVREAAHHTVATQLVERVRTTLEEGEVVG